MSENNVRNDMKMNDEQTMSFIDYYEKEEVLWKQNYKHIEIEMLEGESSEKNSISHEY